MKNKIVGKKIKLLYFASFAMVASLAIDILVSCQEKTSENNFQIASFSFINDYSLYDENLEGYLTLNSDGAFTVSDLEINDSPVQILETKKKLLHFAYSNRTKTIGFVSLKITKLSAEMNGAKRDLIDFPASVDHVF
jgi:hypothetical protein